MTSSSWTTARRPTVAAALERAAREPRVHVVRMGANSGRARPWPPASRRAGARSRRGDRPGLGRAASPGLIPAFVAAARPRGRGDRRSPRAAGHAARPADRERACRAGRSASSWVAACATPRTGCGSSAPTRCATSSRRRDGTRPRRGTSRRWSGAAARWAGSRCRRSTTASRARSAAVVDSARVLGAIVAPAAPRGRADAPRRPRSSASRASGRRGSGSACWSPGRRRPRCRCSARSTSGCSSPSTGSATGPSGSTRRSTRTAGTTCCSRRAAFAVLAATRRLRYAFGALLAMAFAGVFADLVLEVIQLAVNRPRPEEALARRGAQPRASLGAHPSFPRAT